MGVFGSRAFPYPSIIIFALGTAGTSPTSRARRIRRSLPQHHAITHQAHSAILALAPPVIVDAIAVTNIEAALAAISPDGVLDEPRKGLRERRVELPGIDPLGRRLE
jgi:hypothetical protein